MEMVEGTSCESRPPTNMALLADVFHQTATALAALHEQNFVHCDLKPNNILLTRDKKVKVIDFGQACPVGSVKKRIQGTPDFIAPEQVRCEPVTIQTDVYNLGATFYWLLSGAKLPTLFTLKKKKNSFLVADAIKQPHELNPKVPENLSNLVMDCCRTTPAKHRQICPIYAAAWKSSNRPSPVRRPPPACWLDSEIRTINLLQPDTGLVKCRTGRSGGPRSA